MIKEKKNTLGVSNTNIANSTNQQALLTVEDMTYKMYFTNVRIPVHERGDKS